MTLITKLRHLLKATPFFLVLVFFTATGFRFNLPPRLAEALSRLPWIGTHLKLPQVPEKERQEAVQALKEAKVAGAPKYAPSLWQKAQKTFDQGERYLKQGKYDWARGKFKETCTLAQQAAQEARKSRSNLRKTALSKYQQLAEQIEKNPSSSLDLKLQLRYLRSLIEQEDFDSFEKEFQRLRKEIQKLKRGPQPPSFKKDLK